MLTSGDVVDLDLGAPAGREAGFRHPAIIVTAQRVLDAEPSVVQLVPVTSTLRGFSSEVEIDADENLNELRGRLVEIGTSQLLSALGEGFGDPVPQAGEPVYAAKITAADREIDWNEQAVGVHRRVRVGDAFTSFRGKRLKVHRTELAVGEWGHLTPGQTEGAVVGTGGGGLRLMEVQPEGKLRQAAAAWLNGARPSSDDRLGG